MSDLSFSSSEDEDVLIDDVFADLGPSLKKTPPPVGTTRNSRSNKTDDAPIGLAEHAKAKAKAKPNFDSLSELTVDIPSIFLAEGTKNKRILHQDEEITKHLEEEDAKTQSRIATFENEKQKILEEINDNGSGFVFSWNNDSKMIEDFIQKNLANDMSMITLRQFFFFSNVQKPDLSLTAANSSVLKMLRFSPGSPNQFLEYIRVSKLPLSDVVATSLASVCDLDSLAYIEKVIRASSVELKNAPRLRSNSNQTDSLQHKDKIEESPDQIPSFLKLMSAIGAKDITPSATIPVHLKLKHFNNHTRLLLLRLSIIFHFYIPRATRVEEFTTMLQYFYLSCSDFLLNKMDQTALREIVVGPVFELFCDFWVQRYPSESFVDIAHKVFSLISPSVYNSEEIQPQKAYEMHFNMLFNLLHLVSPGNGTSTIVQNLIFKFFDAEPQEEGMSGLIKAVETMNAVRGIIKHTLLSEKRNDVFKNLYKAQLVSIIIQFYIQSDGDLNGKQLLSFYDMLHTCKDMYQEVIGHLSYSTEEDPQEKSRFTLYLSDTYHILDYIVNLLAKSDILPNREFFYGDK